MLFQTKYQKQNKLKLKCQEFCKYLINDFVFMKHVRYLHEKCGVSRETILTNLYLGVRILENFNIIISIIDDLRKMVFSYFTGRYVKQSLTAALISSQIVQTFKYTKGHFFECCII